jgi:hypothetical protein
MAENLAFALFSFDRPTYLQKVLESIYQNKATFNYPWFFFQDGNISPAIEAEYGSKEGTYESLRLIHTYSSLFCKKGNKKTAINIYSSPVNQGIAKMKYRAHFLYDVFDKVMFFEDDMVISPYYIGLLIRMSRQFPDCIVQANDRTGQIPKDDFKSHLNEVIYTGIHWWGYLMPKSAYYPIHNTLSEYVQMIGDDYRRRPHDKIKEVYGVNATSHDAVMDTARKKHNVNKITTFVPRAKYIGEQGMHATPQWYEKNGFNKEKPYIFPEDSTMSEFILK